MAIVAVLAIGVSSCVGFFFWLSRPGTLLEPSKLRAADTTGYVELTLRLEDPGSKKLFDSLIAAGDRGGEQARRAIPSALRPWIASHEHKRNRKQLSELFPLRAAWTMQPGRNPDDDLHILTVSLEKLGNRIVLIDRALEFFFSWNDEVKSVPYDGDTIHQIDFTKRSGASDGHGSEEGTTFFIHGNDVFFTSNLDAAKQALDRLTAKESAAAPRGATPPGQDAPMNGDGGGGATGGQAGGLESMLAGIPSSAALRGAVVGRGEIERLWSWLADEGGEGGEESAVRDEEGEKDEDWTAGAATTEPAPSPWRGVEAMTLHGNFTPEGDLDITLIAFSSSKDAKDQPDPAAMADVLKGVLGGFGLDPKIDSAAEPGRVRIEAKVVDLASHIEHMMDGFTERMKSHAHHRRTYSAGH